MAATASLLVSGCSSEGDASEEPAEASSAETAETRVAEEPAEGVPLTVAFDGDSCVYDGPAELPPGEVTVTLVNDSDKMTYVEMAKLQDGVTFADVTAHTSPEPFEGTRPDDLVGPLEFDQAQAWPGGDGSTGGTVTTGEYVLACLQPGDSDALVWVARPGGVSVTE